MSLFLCDAGSTCLAVTLQRYLSFGSVANIRQVNLSDVGSVWPQSVTSYPNANWHGSLNARCDCSRQPRNSQAQVGVADGFQQDLP